MADIELVIKISDEDYKQIKSTDDFYLSAEEKLIKAGTPLPKGHGALIDRSEVINNLLDYKNGKKTLGQCIEDIKIIIEADWEE